MSENLKRKADGPHDGRDKRAKTKKQWRVPRSNDRGPFQAKAIQPGDSGIWVTCNKGKEGKCIGEILDLFTEHAAQVYPGIAALENGTDRGENGGDLDIEASIQAEINDVRKPGGARLFTPVKLDVQCVVFFKTIPPIEPVSFVKGICEEAMADTQRKRTRFAKRLSPMTLMARASSESLEEVATEVLAAYFHQEPFQKRKFAIRPTIRNHNILTRDHIIKTVASIVGPGHEVDLKNYELLIVVEVYQNICGVSVVDDSFERLKRYNISEIFDPTPKDDNQPGVSAGSS